MTFLEGVPKVQLSITCRLETAVFGEIYKLAGDGVRKRGRKGGGKGKKKVSCHFTRELEALYRKNL